MRRQVRRRLIRLYLLLMLLLLVSQFYLACTGAIPLAWVPAWIIVLLWFSWIVGLLVLWRINRAERFLVGTIRKRQRIFEERLLRSWRPRATE